MGRVYTCSRRTFLVFTLLSSPDNRSGVQVTQVTARFILIGRWCMFRKSVDHDLITMQLCFHTKLNQNLSSCVCVLRLHGLTITYSRVLRPLLSFSLLSPLSAYFYISLCYSILFIPVFYFLLEVKCTISFSMTLYVNNLKKKLSEDIEYKVQYLSAPNYNR